MIFNGYDGANADLRVAARELKVLYHAIDQLTPTQHQIVSQQMQAKGFKEYGSKEVFAILRQFQLAVSFFATSLESAPAKPEDADPLNQLLQ